MNFDYATVTVSLAGQDYATNLANYLYRPPDPVTPWGDLQERIDQQRRFHSGEPEPRRAPNFNGTPWHVFERLRKGEWSPDDVITPIVLGLIGAGNDLATADGIVDARVRNQPITAAFPVALTILGAYLVGAIADTDGDE